jgi:hypothetical protein
MGLSFSVSRFFVSFSFLVMRNKTRVNFIPLLLIRRRMSEKLFVDNDHTQKYRLYRPNYPSELYEHITKFYFKVQPNDAKIPLAVDVACGSGQATVALSA